jgi:predicted aldo/keto reductase-like oxidoreductase
MRYAYYFECQGREKEAMSKYARLKGCDASMCAVCKAPCTKTCPHGMDIRSHLMQAHSLLTLA